MRVADTSALYALFVESDEHHGRAWRAFEDAETVLVPSEILAEFLLLMTRRQGAKAARAAGEALWALPHTEIQPSDTPILMTAWGVHERWPRRLTFSDCIVVAACEELGAEPLSFDRGIARALRR